MAVRVDEARQQRTPVQGHFARARTGKSANIGGAADGEDAPTTDGDRLDDIDCRIDGVDLAPVKMSSALLR